MPHYFQKPENALKRANGKTEKLQKINTWQFSLGPKSNPTFPENMAALFVSSLTDRIIWTLWALHFEMNDVQGVSAMNVDWLHS